jgi:hypothetical protein
MKRISGIDMNGKTIETRRYLLEKYEKTQLSSERLNCKEFVNLNSCLITITRKYSFNGNDAAGRLTDSVLLRTDIM